MDHADPSILKPYVKKRVVFVFAILEMGLTQGIASGTSNYRWVKIGKEAGHGQHPAVKE